MISLNTRVKMLLDGESSSIAINTIPYKIKSLAICQKFVADAEENL